MALRVLFAATLFSAASLPLLALAQETGRPLYLGQIVVYGTSGNGEVFGTNLSDPIEARRIEDKQASSLSDVLRGSPSVITSQRGNPLRALPNIRGFGGTSHMANDPSALMTLDGVSTNGSRVYQNAGAMPVDPALLRSARVLTGPLASLEYGSGVAGGTVAMETINGSDLTGGQEGFRFRQSLGANSNGDGWMTSSTIGWQPSKDMDFLFNFTRRGSDEQKDGEGDKLGLPGFNLPSYLLKARVQLAEDHSLTFSYNKTETAERDVPYGQSTASAVFGNVNRDRDATIASLAWNYRPAGNDFIDLELKYSQSREDMIITPLAGVTGALGAGATFAGRYDMTTQRLSLKNTAQFQTGSVSHNLRAGMEWSSAERDTWGSATRGAPFTPGYGYNPAGKDQRLALFAINNMDFGNELHASLGLRVERQKLTATKSGGVEKFGPFENTAKTLGFGVEQGFGQGVTGFASASFGQSLPILDVATFTSPKRAGSYYGDTLQESRNYELGLKYRADGIWQQGDGLSGSISVYRTEIEDALFGPATGGRSEYFAYEMRGIEVASRYQQASGFYVNAALNVADHKEKHTATGDVWRDYTYNPGTQGAITLGKVWENGLDASWTLAGAKSQDIYNGAAGAAPSHQSGWGVHDINFTYRPQSGALAGTTLNLAIENAFNKTYKQPIAYLNEPGRNVKLSLSKTF